MSYRIEYGSGKPRQQSKDPFSRRLLLTAAFLGIFCALVTLFWQEGRQLLYAILIPGDAEITLEAAEAFADSLSSGASFSHAAADFCRSVLQNGTVLPS